MNRTGGMAWVVLCVLVVGGLALIGGLAAACFTKAFGSVFLGEPRTEEAKNAHEAGLLMRAAMLLLAGACIFIALSAPLWPRVLQSCVASIDPAIFSRFARADKCQSGFSAVNPMRCILGIAGHRGNPGRVRGKYCFAKRNVSQSPTWDCGYVAPDRANAIHGILLRQSARAAVPHVPAAEESIARAARAFPQAGEFSFGNARRVSRLFLSSGVCERLPGRLRSCGGCNTAAFNFTCSISH